MRRKWWIIGAALLLAIAAIWGGSAIYAGTALTAESPTSTFTLTRPVDIAPVVHGTASVQAVGDLTIAGATRQVTVSVQAQISGNTVQVQGSIPITFSDFGVQAPNFGFVQVQDTGSVEMLLQLSK